MKLTMKTEKLKEMVSRAVKGVGNNKLIPLTSLMAIEVKDNKFTLITTDATNYLYIVEDKVVADDFYVVVDADTFSKLISKMTCENVTLEIQSGVLRVKGGNGDYRIELPLDENGEPIKYPDPVVTSDLSSADTITVNRTTIQVILGSIKPALAVTLENPCYTGYYVGDQVVATDTYKIASMDVNLFGRNKRLISPELTIVLCMVNSWKVLRIMLLTPFWVLSIPTWIAFVLFQKAQFFNFWTDFLCLLARMIRMPSILRSHRMDFRYLLRPQMVLRLLIM